MMLYQPGVDPSAVCMNSTCLSASISVDTQVVFITQTLLSVLDYLEPYNGLVYTRLNTCIL